MGKAAEESALESMASSKFKVRRRFSTPTTPDYGIDDLFQHSDKKYYLHKCTHCNHWNKMTYKDVEDGGNIHLKNPSGYKELTREVEDGTFEYVCQKCKRPLDRWYNGSWVAENSEVKSMSGYLISQMNAVWINLN